jgi:hypothetical protein
MKSFYCILLVGALAVPALASKTPKQYEVGTVHPVPYTTTTTTTTCRQGLASVSCDSGDVDSAHVLYQITLADGSTHGLGVHALFTPDPLKGIHADTQVKYRLWHHAGVDYVCVLDSNGKEGRYAFAYHDGPNKPQPEKAAYGPAPVN